MPSPGKGRHGNLRRCLSYQASNWAGRLAAALSPLSRAEGFFRRVAAADRLMPTMYPKRPTMNKPGYISAKPLSVLLGGVFADAYAKQGFASRELVTRWAEIAGQQVANFSEPVKIQFPRPVEVQPQEPAKLILRVEGPMPGNARRPSSVSGKAPL